MKGGRVVLLVCVVLALLCVAHVDAALQAKGRRGKKGATPAPPRAAAAAAAAKKPEVRVLTDAAASSKDPWQGVVRTLRTGAIDGEVESKAPADPKVVPKIVPVAPKPPTVDDFERSLTALKEAQNLNERLMAAITTAAAELREGVKGIMETMTPTQRIPIRPALTHLDRASKRLQGMVGSFIGAAQTNEVATKALKKVIGRRPVAPPSPPPEFSAADHIAIAQAAARAHVSVGTITNAVVHAPGATAPATAQLRARHGSKWHYFNGLRWYRDRFGRLHVRYSRQHHRRHHHHGRLAASSRR